MRTTGVKTRIAGIFGNTTLIPYPKYITHTSNQKGFPRTNFTTAIAIASKIHDVLTIPITIIIPITKMSISMFSSIKVRACIPLDKPSVPHPNTWREIRTTAPNPTTMTLSGFS